MKDIDIDEIACLNEGRSSCESKSALRDMMKLSPDEIDYEKLKRKEESERNVYVDNVEQDIAEEDCNNAIVIDVLLGEFENDIGIVLQQ